MPWITDATLKTAVSGALGYASSSALASHWDNIVPWANRQAYQTIRAVLLARGFTADQIDDWDAVDDWNERIGVCLAIKRGAMRGEQYDTAAAIQDCKDATEELKTVPIVIDGEVVRSSRVSFGDMDTAADRIRIGEPDGSGSFGSTTGEDTTL